MKPQISSTGFIPVSYLVPYPVSYLVSYPRFPNPGIHLRFHTVFIPVACRFHTLVSYLRFHAGFIP
eukprot:14075765-Heterocapsa_arctica.AAC.1